MIVSCVGDTTEKNPTPYIELTISNALVERLATLEEGSLYSCGWLPLLHVLASIHDGVKTVLW